MIVNPDVVDVYISKKTKTSRKVQKKQQPTEKQKNTKMSAKGGPVFTFSRLAPCPPPVNFATDHRAVEQFRASCLRLGFSNGLVIMNADQ